MIEVVKDNFVSNEEIKMMNNYFNKLPHYLQTSKNDGTNIFYTIPLELESVFVDEFYEKCNEFYLKDNFRPIRCYVNVQHKNMDGDFHLDDGNLTCMLMVSKTLKKGEGVFEIDNRSIDFIQNRLVIFDSKLKHRGKGPDHRTMRMTLALKTERIG